MVKYPVSIPLNISAEATEPWLTLLVSAGGTLLDSSGQPAFAEAGSPGYQAADFLHRIFTEKLVDPGAVNLTGQQSEDAFAAGTAAFLLRGGPSSFGSYSNPQTSKISKDTVAGYLIGPNGTGAGVFGLPESVGVPAVSTNKCAAAMFLAWWAETPQEVWRYSGPDGSIFPAQGEAAKQVLSAGDPAQAKQVEDVLPNIKPLFSQGAPTWYPQFANDAATVLQAITIGDTSCSGWTEHARGPDESADLPVATATGPIEPMEDAPVASTGGRAAARSRLDPAAATRTLGPRYLPYVFVAASVVIIAVFNIIPLAFAVWDSVHVDSPLKPDRGFIALQNYVSVLADPAFQNASVNTLQYLLLTIVGVLGIGLRRLCG